MLMSILLKILSIITLSLFIISLSLFHTMAHFYLIYRYVISKSRSIRPVEINQYDITMGNDDASDTYCEITMDNDVARDIHCDVTMIIDVDMCTYHGINKHNDTAMNLFYYVFAAVCLVVLFYYE